MSESWRYRKDRISNLPRTCPGALGEGLGLVVWAAGAEGGVRDCLEASLLNLIVANTCEVRRDL